MKLTRITGKLIYVEPDSMARFHSCAGLMVDSDTRIFIDMNLGSEDTQSLVKTHPPQAAFITHYHLDHSTWTRIVNETSDARVFIPQGEQNYFTSLDFMVDQTARPFGQAEEWKSFMVNQLGYTPLKTFQAYEPDTSFAEFCPEMVLMETPGHSPCHTSFYFPDEKILFSGDLGLDRFGPWYGWEDCDLKKILESLLRMDGMEVGLILTSHGGIIRKNIHETLAKSLGFLLGREEKIRQQLDGGRTLGQIVEKGVFYPGKKRVGPPMSAFLEMWETAMVTHHLNLLDQGGILAYFPEINGFCRV